MYKIDNLSVEQNKILEEEKQLLLKVKQKIEKYLIKIISQLSF